MLSYSAENSLEPVFVEASDKRVIAFRQHEAKVYLFATDTVLLFPNFGLTALFGTEKSLFEKVDKMHVSVTPELSIVH